MIKCWLALLSHIHLERSIWFQGQQGDMVWTSSNWATKTDLKVSSKWDISQLLNFLNHLSTEWIGKGKDDLEEREHIDI